MNNAMDTVDGDVPRVYDTIYILFELEGSGDAYWWPSSVLQSVETKNSNVVKGSGKVEYAARHNLKKEQGDVIFLADRMVTTHLGDTPWRTATEHADAGAGDAGDCDWEKGSRKPRTQRTHDDVTQGNTSAAQSNTGDRPSRKSKRKGTPRRRIDPAKKVQGERHPTSGRVVRRTCRGKARVTGAAHGERQSTPKKGAAGSAARHGEQSVHDQAERSESTLSASMKHTSHLVRRLGEEVTELKSSMRSNLEAERQYEINHKIDEKVIIWKANMQSELARAVRESRSNDNLGFASVLNRGLITVKDVVSYETFTQVVRGMLRQIDETPPFGYTFLPSLEDIRNPGMDIGEAHILFDSARAMFRFLGMGSKVDVRSAIAKTQMVRGAPHIRLLGGMQWSGKEEDAIRLFVGSSCVGEFKEEEDNGSVQADAVVFENAVWDNSNTAMASQPALKKERVGTFAGERRFNDSKEAVFAMSWRWRRGFEGRAFSAHARSTSHYRLGDVTFTLPYVLLKGTAICEQISGLLTDDFLDSC